MRGNPTTPKLEYVKKHFICGLQVSSSNYIVWLEWMVKLPEELCKNLSLVDILNRYNQQLSLLAVYLQQSDIEQFVLLLLRLLTYIFHLFWEDHKNVQNHKAEMFDFRNIS